MTHPLPYVEALRDFDPLGKKPPILGEPLTRIATEAARHFGHWEPSPLDDLAEGLDAMYRAVERQDRSAGLYGDESTYPTSEDVRLLGFERAVLGRLYRQFVCRRVVGADLLDALMIHAYAAAAQTNALAHRIAEQDTVTVDDCEQLAGQAMYAQELLDAAKTSRDGVAFAEWTTSTRSRQAADVRHGKAHTLKARFVDFYRQGEFRSKADAACRFFGQLPEDDQRTLTPSLDPDNAIRTLTAALRQSSQ